MPRRKSKQQNYCAGECSAGIESTAMIRSIPVEVFVDVMEMPKDLADSIKMQSIYHCSNCNTVWITMSSGNQIIIQPSQPGHLDRISRLYRAESNDDKEDESNPHSRPIPAVNRPEAC